MNRFRPNIVVGGIQAFAEHVVADLAAARYGIGLRRPCERCVVTTIDQLTAIPDPEHQPFRTLRDLNPVEGRPRAPAFGQNAVLTHGAGEVIRVGDRLLSAASR